MRLSFFVVLKFSSFAVSTGRNREFVRAPCFALLVAVLDVGRFPLIGACRYVSVCTIGMVEAPYHDRYTT